MSEKDKIVHIILEHHPDAQAIYLFGSHGTAEERKDSDVDIAILLPPQQKNENDSLIFNDLCYELETLLAKDVDLSNLRQAPTVLQKEIIAAERRIYCADQYAADEFEMLTISYYQRLNEERAGIIKDVLEVGRIIV
ncbi:MAG: nucleotidyltransferase domain-containing protein [Anaerolineales bacterium]|uniref:Nucleotidyltransferase domain-containing protein n=1 Tax=Candidatus Desulfolinea nitratireducens TaxID=2841698 RepID=A0A8J6TIA6_9CHLR|nr:nucleotidyltransferase domain-containing protein [Candidatus Desulfolinea nitratireducens]MBL6960442.1 nucleotidyltransferase domain-containing protein [Anaerolineales bacterium]